MKWIIDRTTVSEADWIEEVYPDQWPAEVTIETDADTYSIRREYARGEPENSLSWSELVEKYEELTEPIVGATAAAEAQSVIEDLEEHSVGDLVIPFAEAEQQAVADD